MHLVGFYYKNKSNFCSDISFISDESYSYTSISRPPFLVCDNGLIYESADVVKVEKARCLVYCNKF